MSLEVIKLYMKIGIKIQICMLWNNNLNGDSFLYFAMQFIEITTLFL